MDSMFKFATAFDQDLGLVLGRSDIKVDMPAMFGPAWTSTRPRAGDVRRAVRVTGAACGVSCGRPCDAPTHRNVMVNDGNSDWPSRRGSTDATAAEATYGHISTWETRG